MARLDRTYGTEIEFQMPEGGTPAQVAAAVDARLSAQGRGRCREVPYGHTSLPRDAWSLVTDGSVGHRGRELVAPILLGDEGFRCIEAVMGALEDYGCTVNRDCGLHVHVGVGSQNPPIRHLRELVKCYSYFEGVIDAAMPASRRGGMAARGFARTMTRPSFAQLDRAPNYGEIVYLVTGERIPPRPYRNASRYTKLNLASLRDYPTVEFRQHSGTLSAPKTIHWVNFCLAMVEAIWAGGSVAPVSGQAAPGRSYAGGNINRARIGSHAWQVGQMMLRPEGVTRQEAMAACGWPSISLPQQAEACGLAYTTTRMGHTVRYYANRGVAEAGEIAAEAAMEGQAFAQPAAPAATLDGLASFIGLDAAESVYFQQRTRDLGGAVSWAA